MVFRMAGAWGPSTFTTLHLSSPLPSVGGRRTRWEGGFSDLQVTFPQARGQAACSSKLKSFIFVTKKERCLLSPVHLKQILLKNFKYHKTSHYSPGVRFFDQSSLGEVLPTPLPITEAKKSGSCTKMAAPFWIPRIEWEVKQVPKMKGCRSQMKRREAGASLVAQWLRICLPMQGTWVRALVWEDPTCRGATRPVSHNY